MKKAILVFLLLAGISVKGQSIRVKGYTKKNGTYVAPARRTRADKTQRNNWSSKPNRNPYTGKRGTRTPKN